MEDYEMLKGLIGNLEVAIRELVAEEDLIKKRLINIENKLGIIIGEEKDDSPRNEE